MSTEQNESHAVQVPQGPLAATGDGSPAATSQQRRRRRRRKANKGGGGAPPAEMQNGATPASSAQTTILSGPEQSPDQATDPSLDPGREPYRSAYQQGKQKQNQPRDASGQDAQRPRQAFSQQQGKRQGKGGSGGGSNGSNQGGGSAQGRPYQKAAPQQQPVYRENNPGNGIGNGMGNGQPGGRRKNKIRRAAPSFVGPMDHSYRVANGNIADSSPSTMDFRSNVNGNGNGNVYVRGYSEFGEAPAVLREDAPVRIVCFIEDLFVVAKMQETARKLGVKVSFAKAEKDTVTKLIDMPEAERPSLIVFDLNNVNAKPLTLIPKLKAKLKRATSVIGFLSHVQGDLKVKAIEAGCDMVMPKSAFSQNLPNLLRRHGLDEEVEAVEV
ncbi:MAG TPA: response regulator [Acidobacteriaceae bacterium]